MIHINLLPFRAARKKENIRRQISIFLLTFIFTAVALVYYNGTLNGSIERLETSIAKTKAELATFKKTIQEIKKIKSQLKTLENKTKVINKLNTDRKWPLTFLDTINDMIIEKRMWLTSLQMTKSVNITIKGIALDNKTVADFMTRLEKSKVFTSVNLNTINQKKIKKYNLKSFAITCKKVVKKKPKQKTAPSKAKK